MFATSRFLLIAVAVGGLAGCGKDEPTGTTGPTIPTILASDFSGWPDDPLTLTDASVRGDALVLKVQYGGGCEDHLFSLVISPVFMESQPVQTGSLLSHDSKGDTCEALLSGELVADLTPLKEEWQAAYQRQSGSIVLHLGIDSTTAPCDDTPFDRPGRCSLLYSF